MLCEDVKCRHDSVGKMRLETTKKLLRHWWREDRSRRLFFCQVEAVETIIYLQEILAQGKKPRWTPQLAVDEYHALCKAEPTTR